MAIEKKPKSPALYGYLYSWNAQAHLPIRSTRIIIGRSEGDLQYPKDKAMSGAHCMIQIEGLGRAFIRDLGSSNGTHLASKKLPPEQRLVLPEAVWIQVGSHLFQLRWTTRKPGHDECAGLPQPEGKAGLPAVNSQDPSFVAPA